MATRKNVGFRARNFNTNITTETYRNGRLWLRIILKNYQKFQNSWKKIVFVFRSIGNLQRNLMQKSIDPAGNWTRDLRQNSHNRSRRSTNCATRPIWTYNIFLRYMKAWKVNFFKFDDFFGKVDRIEVSKNVQIFVNTIRIVVFWNVLLFWNVLFCFSTTCGKNLKLCRGNDGSWNLVEVNFFQMFWIFLKPSELIFFEMFCGFENFILFFHNLRKNLNFFETNDGSWKSVEVKFFQMFRIL